MQTRANPGCPETAPRLRPGPREPGVRWAIPPKRASGEWSGGCARRARGHFEYRPHMGTDRATLPRDEGKRQIAPSAGLRARGFEGRLFHSRLLFAPFVNAPAHAAFTLDAAVVGVNRVLVFGLPLERQSLDFLRAALLRRLP